MTPLLEQALAAAQGLPESEQNTIASLIMAEIADEGQWEKQFAATQQPLERWANKVRADIQAGRVQDIGSTTISPIS
jgi:hypothetical protein